MKKTVFLSLFLVIILVSISFAENLKVGMTAPDWAFPDSFKTEYSMKSWEGKVLLVNYVDPDEKDLNEHFTDAMKKAKDEGRLTDEGYKGIGIVDCAATWKPNVAIRALAKKKAEKYKTVILFDTDAVLRKQWGLSKDTANAILLDKNRVVRYVMRGRVPDEEVAKVVDLAVELQKD